MEKVTATGDAVQDADPSFFDQDGTRYPPAGAGTLKQARASKPRRTRESHRFVTYSRYMVFKVLSPAIRVDTKLLGVRSSSAGVIGTRLQ